MRQIVYAWMERTDHGQPGARWLQMAIIALIAINVIAVTLETDQDLYNAHARWFHLFDVISVAIFSVEYAIRLWVCVEAPEAQGHRFPRLRYMVTPMAVIDLLAILPFYLTAIFHVDLRFLRALRLLRIFKLTRYSTTMTILLEVFREEASTFFASFFILFILLILTASGAYLVEHEVQPDKFGSVPMAMWWAVVTLTTVGYGDVTPITAAGKVFGAFATVIGVGMAAMPAGILASGLADHLHRRRDYLRSRFRIALEDGYIDRQEGGEIETLRKQLGISRETARMIREEVLEQHRSNAPMTMTCPHCSRTCTINPREAVK
ncbi:MAG: ion transporter [Geminicoccaceae bacterium]|nr:ion transporter [Geminicoccaceae bacterium]